MTKSKRFRQFAAGTTQVVRLDDLPESRTRRATNRSTANKKGAGAAVPFSSGSVPFITPQQQQQRKQQQLPPPGNYNRTLTLLVRLSGELCNHLALLANAYRMKRYVEHHIPGLTLQMIGEHQSHDKWIHAYRDLTKCFVNFDQFEFLGGIHDIPIHGFSIIAHQQETWLGTNATNPREVGLRVIFVVLFEGGTVVGCSCGCCCGCGCFSSKDSWLKDFHKPFANNCCWFGVVLLLLLLLLLLFVVLVITLRWTKDDGRIPELRNVY